MARLKVKDGANAVGYRRSLLLSAAIATLITATAGTRPASAQSVTGSGLADSGGNPIPAQSSPWTVGGNLVVGQSSDGTLDIEGGGKVTNDTGYIGAEATGGVGSNVTVSGHDASGNASTWTNTEQLNIGDNGTGSLTIQDGGVVSVGQNAVLGLNSDGTGSGVGTVLVTGRDANGNASTFNVTNTIDVGEDAQDNRLDIQNGGVVNSGAGAIGDASSSTGTVTVSGRDANGNASAWNSGNIYVGYQGIGMLNIEDGGQVTSSGPGGAATTVYIGYSAGSQGTVNVSSSNGSASTLTTSNDIEVGVDGAGTLNIGKGGWVSSGTVVTIAVDHGSSGILNLNGDASGRGVLETSAVNAGAGTVTLNLNGGILRATQDNDNFLNGFTTLAVGAGGAWFDTNTHDITISTDFLGTSSFNKLGLGTLILTGDSSAFTGATTVSGGTLLVNGSIAGSAVGVQSGAILAGNGWVGATTVLTGGTIAPGNNSIGTLHVNGAYAQNIGSIYQVLVDPNSNASSMIAVTGAATLANGAVLNVTKSMPGNYQVGTLYTVLSATNGVSGTYTLTGDTATVSTYLNLTDIYDANHAYLTVKQTRAIGAPATTPNQGATAGGIGSLPNGNPVVTDVLNSPTDAAARAAFDQLSGEIHASAKTAALENSHFVRDAAIDRIREAFCAVGATAMDRKLVVTQTGLAQAPTDQKPGASGCATGGDRFTVWGQVFGSWGHTNGNGNAASLDRDTGGFFTGIDAPIFNGWRAGILTGYGRSDFNVSGRASSGSSDDYYAGLYGGTQWGALGLRTGLTYTTQDIRTDRSAFFPGVGGSLSSGYNAGTMQIFGDLGYKVDVGRIAFEPFANLAYVHLHTNGFSEQGGAAALTSHGGDTDTSFTTLGLRGSTGFVLFGTMSATARGSLGWRHAFGDITPVSTVSLAGGNDFTIAGVPIAVDEAVADAGLDLHVNGRTTIGLSYSGQFGSGATDQGVRGNFIVRF
jgi:outer membrane autotransporter protein